MPSPDPPTLPYLQPALFTDVPGLVAGFSTRHGGVSSAPFASLNLSLSSGDDRMHVLENRSRFFASVGLSADRLAVAGQVHGSRVLHVTDPGLYPGYDALVADQTDLVLTITAADCAVVLLADPEARVIGAVHSGWRGTVARITEHAVAEMETLGAHRSRLIAYISPCISTRHFEVGPEVAARFEATFVHHLPGEPRPHIDLKAAIAAQLREAGISDARMEISPACTFAETDTFFSYRAEGGTTGRMMGFIGWRRDA